MTIVIQDVKPTIESANQDDFSWWQKQKKNLVFDYNKTPEVQQGLLVNLFLINLFQLFRLILNRILNKNINPKNRRHDYNWKVSLRFIAFIVIKI